MFLLFWFSCYFNVFIRNLYHWFFPLSSSFHFPGSCILRLHLPSNMALLLQWLTLPLRPMISWFIAAPNNTHICFYTVNYCYRINIIYVHIDHNVCLLRWQIPYIEEDGCKKRCAITSSYERLRDDSMTWPDITLFVGCIT